MELPGTSPPPPRKTRYRVEAEFLSYSLAANSLDYWRRWCYRVHEEQAAVPVLRNVSCEARPGELMAIVGPSGAGKTTLLSLLAGAGRQQRGRVLLNGRPTDAARLRRVSGHVTQDDALYPLLTVEESLAYSARLRLGAGRRKAAGRVGELLAQLGLDRVASSRVGTGHGGRGISGGEKRRVSIGVELVHNPAILLLDEPTSGLDSAAALHIVSLLKSMARVQGKTVVLTIHQPGFRILELFDQVLLLAGGTVRHRGSLELLERRLELAGHLIPPHVNVLEYAIDFLPALDVEISPSSSFPDQLTAAAAKEERARPVGHANPALREVLILGERFFKNISRTNPLFLAKALQCLAAGLGLGSVFVGAAGAQARLGFFAFSLTFLLSSTTEGLPVFLQERRILARETSRGAYRVSSYVVANALVFLPFLLITALLFAAPAYWVTGLRPQADGFLWFSLVVWMVMAMANSFVTCFAALVPNYIMGNSVIAGLIGCFFLFSGYFIRKESMPKYWVFVHYLSLFKYPFEVFLINEFGGERGGRQCLWSAGDSCVLDGEAFLREQGLGETQIWTRLVVMLAFICGYRLLCFAILWFRCSRRRT